MEPRLASASFLVLLAGAVLAGCSSPGGPTAGHGPDLGALRVLVVDEAIRPVAGVNVTLLHGTAAVASNATGADGLVAFLGLEPGGYILQANASGYIGVQQPVDVAAGSGEPPLVKLQLQVQAGGLPFHSDYVYEGYVECSASEGNWCGIANFYPCYVEQQAGQSCTGNLTNDRSIVEFDLMSLQRVPDWVQVEMVWESNQAVSPYLYTRIDLSSPSEATIANSTGLVGGSPLLVVYPPDWFKAWGLGLNHTLTLEAFHGGPQAVCDNDPTHSNNCVLTGAAVEQRFTWYLNVFYGYTPPEGWRFTTDGTVPPPPS